MRVGTALRGLIISFTSCHFAFCFTNVQKLDIATNLSDHHPVSGTFDYLVCSTPHLASPTVSQSTPRTTWYNVNDSDIQNFQYMISDSLPTLPSDLVLCSDPSCLKHRSSLVFYCSTLLQHISDAAQLTLPVTSKFSPCIAG